MKRFQFGESSLRPHNKAKIIKNQTYSDFFYTSTCHLAEIVLPIMLAKQHELMWEQVFAKRGNCSDFGSQVKDVTAFAAKSIEQKKYK